MFFFYNIYIIYLLSVQMVACGLQIIEQYGDLPRSGNSYSRQSSHVNNYGHTQLDEQYLRYCQPKEIIKQLEFHECILMFVSDLKYSIEKQFQDKFQLTQWNIETKQSFGKVLLIEKQLLGDYKELTKREAQLSSTVERLFKVLLIERGCWKSMFRSNKMSSRQECLNRLNELLQSRMQECCSYRKKSAADSDESRPISHDDNKSEQQDQFYEISSGTYEPYLSDLKKFLTNGHYDISLYNYLKNCVHKWILEHYKEQVKNQLNLLGLSENYQLKRENYKEQVKNQLNQLGLIENYKLKLLKTNKMTTVEEQEKKLAKQMLKVKQSSSDSPLQKDSSSQKNSALSIETTYSINNKGSEQANQKQDSFLVKLRDQQSKINIHSLIHAPLVNVVDLRKICCVNFFYEFSAIEANKYNALPQLTNNIIILMDEKQKQTINIKDNANQNSQNSNANQKAKNSPVPTTPPPHPVSQAVCALLNNQGGYILIGFQKSKEFYQPASESASENLLTENQYYTLIKKSFPKCWEDEKFRSMIKVSYIPIVQRSKPRPGKQNLWQLQEPKQNKFICRIKVQPKDEYQRMFYSIGGQKNEKDSVEGKSFAYDIVKQDLNIRQLTGQEIYKKMKQIQKFFGTFSISGKKTFYKSLNKNQFKIKNHLEKICKNIEQGFLNLIPSYKGRISAKFLLLTVNKQLTIQQKKQSISKIRKALNKVIQRYKQLEKANLVSKNINRLRLNTINGTINMLDKLAKRQDLRINTESQDEEQIITACQQLKVLQDECNSKIKQLLSGPNEQSRKQLIRLKQFFWNHKFALQIYLPCRLQFIFARLAFQQLPDQLQQLSSMFVDHSQVCRLINSIIAKFIAQFDHLKLEEDKKISLIEWIVFNKPLPVNCATELQIILFGTITFKKVTFSLGWLQIMQQFSNPNLLYSRGNLYQEITHYLDIIRVQTWLLGTTYQNRMNRPYCIYPVGFNHNQLYFETYGRQPPYDVIYNNVNGQWYNRAQGKLMENQYQPFTRWRTQQGLILVPNINKKGDKDEIKQHEQS